MNDTIGAQRAIAIQSEIKRGLTMPNAKSVWRVLDRIAVVSMIVASGAVVWSVLSRETVQGPTGVRTASPEEMDGKLPAEVLKHAASKGRAEAQVAMIEFSDYQCPFCGRNARDVHPRLQRDFIDTGKIRYAFVNFPIETIHRQAFKAAEAAECSKEQDKYWEMHDRLFTNQQALGPKDLLRYADDLGLDHEGFSTCLDGKLASKIREDLELGRGLEVSSTPVFLAGDIQADGSVKLRYRLNGAVPYSSFKDALEKLLN